MVTNGASFVSVAQWLKRNVVGDGFEPPSIVNNSLQAKELSTIILTSRLTYQIKS